MNVVGDVHSHDAPRCDTEQGKVMVDLRWLPVTGDKEVIRAASRTSGAEDNTEGLVHIYVDSVEGEL